MHDIFFVHKQHDFLWYQGDNQILSSKQTGMFFHNLTIFRRLHHSTYVPFHRFCRFSVYTRRIQRPCINLFATDKIFAKVDVLVTTAGGIEEDFIKCLAPSYLGDFKMKGKELRANGVNRIGNLLVPNGNYCLFEDWLTPILHSMTDEQVKNGTRWSPSTMIDRLGKEINNEESVYYWAHKNKIPVFCPALTDGSIGDMLYFHSFKRPEFILDVVQDIRGINNIAVHAPCTGM